MSAEIEQLRELYRRVKLDRDDALVRAMMHSRSALQYEDSTRKARVEANAFDSELGHIQESLRILGAAVDPRDSVGEP